MTRLGPVHRLIGSNQQLVQRLSFITKGRSANAYADAGLTVSANLQRKLGNRCFDATAQILYLIANQLLDNSHKLIAGISRHKIILAQLALNDASHLSQHLVAHLVAKGVVNNLEVIEIKHDHREWPASPARA